MHIINIYNAPAGSPRSSALHLLYSLSLPFQDSLLLMSDFNLHHTRWQPSWSHSPSPGAEIFTEWIDENGLTLLSPMDKATHDRGNVLDLVFGSASLIQKAKCTLAPHLVLERRSSEAWRQ